MVLSQEEMSRVLQAIHQPRYQIYLRLIYGCGLRLQEGVQLHVNAVDDAGMVELADIFRTYGSAYRAKYAQRMPPSVFVN
jgi:integrase